MNLNLDALTKAIDVVKNTEPYQDPHLERSHISGVDDSIWRQALFGGLSSIMENAIHDLDCLINYELQANEPSSTSRNDCHLPEVRSLLSELTIYEGKLKHLLEIINMSREGSLY